MPHVRRYRLTTRNVRSADKAALLAFAKRNRLPPQVVEETYCDNCGETSQDCRCDLAEYADPLDLEYLA